MDGELADAAGEEPRAASEGNEYAGAKRLMVVFVAVADVETVLVDVAATCWPAAALDAVRPAADVAATPSALADGTKANVATANIPGSAQRVRILLTPPSLPTPLSCV